MFGKVILINLFIIFFIISGNSQSNTQNRQTTDAQMNKSGAAELVSEGMAAYRNKDFVKSAQLLQAAVDKGFHDRGTLYDTACSTALAGDKEAAFQFLFKAVKAGFRNTEHLKQDSDLDLLHNDPRWPKILAGSEKQQEKYLKDHRDPNKVQFVTDDITRFWQIYDRAKAENLSERASILQREYIEPGTIGLKDFSSTGRLDAKGLAEKIEKYPNFFNAIRNLTLGIKNQRVKTIDAFRKLKEFYPQAVFPDTFFIMAQMKSGGTSSDNGLLIGAEMFTRSADTPTAEFTGWEKGAIMEPEEIPFLVAHESIHFQQKFPSDKSLLCSVLKEGSADFIGELISGHLINRMQQTHIWANARESNLWEEFEKEMDGTDISHWLYASSGNSERPVDLGYWMGYKISEAYYKNAADKNQAVKDTLLMKDCREYLKTSHYAEKFR